MLEAAIRTHYAEQAFQCGLLKNEGSRKTPNHCPYNHDGIHFHVLRPHTEQSACRCSAGGLAARVFAMYCGNFEEGIRIRGYKLRRAGGVAGDRNYGEIDAAKCGAYPLFNFKINWPNLPPQAPVPRKQLKLNRRYFEISCDRRPRHSVTGLHGLTAASIGI
jgi:hypothetical protein